MLFLTAFVAIAEDSDPAVTVGSYGRAQASTDLRGGGGTGVDVVAHPPRTALGSYLELDLGWKVTTDDGATFRALVTPAFAGDPFHYDGEFDADLALRNLYAEADGFVPKVPLAVWAGSRMYRGDDVYLLDFWPLDDQNTMGGGARLHPDHGEVALHVGVNRLVGQDWQVQDLVELDPGGVSGQTVRVLNRQRTVISGRLGGDVDAGDVTLRGRLYGELHALPEGTAYVDDPFTSLRTEVRPSDRGSMVGVQLSAYGWANQSYVHLWARRSTGLAAIDELAIPADGLADDERVAKARDWMVAVAGNQEFGPVGVAFGGYLDYRTDADGLAFDFDDRWELVGVVRPSVYPTEHLVIGAEFTHEFVRPNGINPRSGEWDKANVTKISVLPGIQPHKGQFSRPRVQLVYTASFLDDDARQFYSALDARVHPGVQHYLGIGAEWWIQSQRTVLPTR